MEYEIMVPPFRIKDFREMSIQEAKQHYDWYISQIPKRMEILREAFTSSNDRAMLDFTPESLKPLWNWFIPLVVTRKMSKKEIAEEIKKTPDWLKEYMQQEQHDKLIMETLGVLSDIAIYFAEVFVRNQSALRWDYITAPEDFYSVNRPVILGFKFNKDLDPHLIIHNQTLKVARGINNPNALYDLYNIWLEFI